jgi:hypothetical protein
VNAAKTQATAACNTEKVTLQTSLNNTCDADKASLASRYNTEKASMISGYNADKAALQASIDECNTNANYARTKSDNRMTQMANDIEIQRGYVSTCNTDKATLQSSWDTEKAKLQAEIDKCSITPNTGVPATGPASTPAAFVAPVVTAPVVSAPVVSAPVAPVTDPCADPNYGGDECNLDLGLDGIEVAAASAPTLPNGTPCKCVLNDGSGKVFPDGKYDLPNCTWATCYG